eukprot:jgi/Ulvmu1/9420/UM051_0048.1
MLFEGMMRASRRPSAAAPSLRVNTPMRREVHSEPEALDSIAHSESGQPRGNSPASRQHPSGRVESLSSRRDACGAGAFHARLQGERAIDSVTSCHPNSHHSTASPEHPAVSICKMPSPEPVPAPGARHDTFQTRARHRRSCESSPGGAASRPSSEGSDMSVTAVARVPPVVLAGRACFTKSKRPAWRRRKGIPRRAEE